MKEYKTEDKVLALLAHIGFVTGIGYFFIPLVIWLVKKDSSTFVATHAKQAMVWQGACFVGGSLLATIGSVISFLTIGLGLFLFIPLMLLLAIALFIPSILASIAVFNEKPYTYPVTGVYAERL